MIECISKNELDLAKCYVCSKKLDFENDNCVHLNYHKSIYEENFDGSFCFDCLYDYIMKIRNEIKCVSCRKKCQTEKHFLSVLYRKQAWCLMTTCSEKCRQRMKKLLKLNTEIGVQYQCSFCHINMPKMSVCAKCKRVAYCSITCQKNDWKQHKSLCSEF